MGDNLYIGGSTGYWSQKKPCPCWLCFLTNVTQNKTYIVIISCIFGHKLFGECLPQLLLAGMCPVSGLACELCKSFNRKLRTGMKSQSLEYNRLFHFRDFLPQFTQQNNISRYVYIFFQCIGVVDIELQNYFCLFSRSLSEQSHCWIRDERFAQESYRLNPSETMGLRLY